VLRQRVRHARQTIVYAIVPPFERRIVQVEAGCSDPAYARVQ
jgi:hypothetical protein